MKKQKPPDPDVVRFTNGTPQPPPTYIAIHELSEPDVRLLADGLAPDWLVECAKWWTRDHPKPSDVPPPAREVKQEVA